MQDLVLYATSNWLLAFDNVSALPGWQSDALGQVATGGGFAARQLYSDDEEWCFKVGRPVVLNGIPDFVGRPDLLDRTVLVWHPRIPPDRRRRRKEFWAAFEAAHPRILGALLGRLAGGLRVRAEGDPPADLPRMADFAELAVACERGAGEGPRFLAAYTANEADAREQALVASPVAQAVVRLLDGRDGWAGSATELLAELASLAPVPTPRDWPRAGNGLTGTLRRLAPALRHGRGLDVNCDIRAGGRDNGRVVRITRAQPPGVSSASSDTPPSDGADDTPATLFEPGDAFEPSDNLDIPY